MTIITIQCRLTASEATRRHLWELMADRNTPFVGTLMEAIKAHENFSTWQRWGEVPLKAVDQISKPLRKDERFSGQPGRFYSSANIMTTYTYKAWFALQASRHRRLEGLQRWVSVLKSDAEMLEICNVSLETLQSRAQAILQDVTSVVAKEVEAQAKSRQGNRTQPQQAATIVPRGRVLKQLFKIYDGSPDQLTYCATTHLLKNGCAVPKELESDKKYQKMLLSKQNAIRNLKRQLDSSLPKSRDISGERYLEALDLISNQIPSSTEELNLWEAKLLREPNPVPYPIVFGSNLDLGWSVEEITRGKFKKPKQQICVKFNGLGKHIFKVQCDRRQHHYLQRFVQDCHVYDNGKGPISGSLLLLRTSSLMWRSAEKNHCQKTGKPWSDHYLYLHCQIETNLLTQQGVDRIRQRKLKAAETSASKPANQATDSKTSVKRAQGVINRLQLSKDHPISLPNRAAYQGNPHLILGVSLNLDQPVTLAVVDVEKSSAVKYYTAKQLLKTTDKRTNQVHLLNRKKVLQVRNRRKRHLNLKRGASKQHHEAGIGLYLDSLLAKRIVDVAIQYRVSKIVIPNTVGLRDKLESQLRASAESKIPGSVIAQDQYSQTASQHIHHWSYRRLSNFIHSRSAKLGMPIEVMRATLSNTPQSTAYDLAIAAYDHRQATTINVG